MAQTLTLIIGNKNYSSWSLRPWILMKYFKIPFKEILIPLYEGDYKNKVYQYSPNGKVPALLQGKVTVWESLAICEYIADLYPRKEIWPKDKPARAWARSISSEMHAGFGKLRANMPMNLRGSYPGKGITPESAKDISRVIEIWTECRKKFKKQGPFLFGKFSVADAMFAPVVTRFRTYGVDPGAMLSEYMKSVLETPAFKEWEAAGLKESWVITGSEIYNPIYAGRPAGH